MEARVSSVESTITNTHAELGAKVVQIESRLKEREAEDIQLRATLNQFQAQITAELGKHNVEMSTTLGKQSQELTDAKKGD